ncbi:MAG: SUMF1/EgtB/PvdO family nonheme iron enzyme [Verrucomicrobia bacterium]|nr:SUMF1/EgtB/PvdO family nonheme iron enzyme [Verrucomicrobiota bacterium]
MNRHSRLLSLLCAGSLPVLLSTAQKAAELGSSFTNSIGLKLVRLEPGEFKMGSAEGDFDEEPVHSVKIGSGFYMAATEISNAQYEQFDPSHRAARGRLGLSKDDDEAVVFVSWHEAARFCGWLAKKEGKPYRLPTEAEWEYACRAGSSTAFHTGDKLPDAFHKSQRQDTTPAVVPLHIGRTPPNAWGFHDMHGNVEEWCLDWYGPYRADDEIDPVGAATGDFKVSRGGSHNTPLPFLRSANRSGTLPEDKHWLIGFRVVLAESLKTAPRAQPAPPRWAIRVRQDRHAWSGGPDPAQPYFKGPREFVKIPPSSNGPLFSQHNHQPALAACPNGDLLAIWYSCRTEAGRELGVVASRLRLGQEEWEPAAPFWDAPDRNDHGNALWWDGRETLYHFNGLGTDGTWGKLALIMRTSTDHGATWSKARLIHPEHGLRHQVIAGVFQTREGHLVLPCDAVTGGNGGTAIHISRDQGQTWTDPGEAAAKPDFADGQRGAWIAGIHAGVTELKDGRLMALGRGDSIHGQMPRSVSADGGRTWTYSASGLPTLGGGQRLVLRRLKEGPLFLASFAKQLTLTNAAGEEVQVSGLFGALSFDEGFTWPVRRLITDDGPARELDGGGNTRKFTLSTTNAEPRGYLAGTQTPDGVIHLISSKQHYAFNAAWLKAAMPVNPASETAKQPAKKISTDRSSAGQPKPSSDKTPPASEAADRADLEQKFKETLSNSVLVGRWCLVKDGKLGEEREEKYTIRTVNKAGEDLWLIFARVQYGEKDVTLPVPVQVKWAGDTPVISITNLGLPGLGTYTARVVIYDRTYAGTWSGPNYGGLLHGIIEKAK